MSSRRVQGNDTRKDNNTNPVEADEEAPPDFLYICPQVVMTVAKVITGPLELFVRIFIRCGEAIISITIYQT